MLGWLTRELRQPEPTEKCYSLGDQFVSLARATEVRQQSVVSRTLLPIDRSYMRLQLGVDTRSILAPSGCASAPRFPNGPKDALCSRAT
jgi:hypothetical protein